MSNKHRAKKRKSLSHSQREVLHHKTQRHSQDDKKQARPTAITGRRLWLFRIIAVTVFPALLLLVAELSLRTAGYGFFPHAIMKCQVDGEDAYCDNVKFGWRFFPRNIARESESFVFPANKPDNTYRIFILGASAAQGTPEPAFSFGRILQEMLHDRYPGVNFEIINTAMTAINSHVVLEIAKDCARHDPDLFIVYLGNNEVTGPYGAGTVYTLPLVNLSVIRTGIALKATRLGQLLTGLADSVGAEKNTPRVWRGLEMFLDNQVRADTPPLESVYRNFQRNIKDIGQIALKSRSKIIFCTVGSNLKDNPPFASLHRSDLTPTEMKNWDDIYRQGVEFELTGDYADAIERYLEAAKIDDRYADLQFRLGRCYWVVAEYEKARTKYIRARELDTLRFRADSRINNIIRETANGRVAECIYLTDTTEVFEKNSPNAIPGWELFYEHVHLNFKGNYFLAKAVFEQLEKILPQQLAQLRQADNQQILTEGQCVQRLAYTGWDRYQIADKVLKDFIKKPPFTNQLYQQERIRQMEQNIEALKIYLAPEALENSALQYRQAIQKSPSDWRLHWKYGKLLTEGFKDYQAAAEQFRLVRQFLPHSYIVYTALGAASRGLGDIDEVVAQYQEAIRVKPTCIDAHYYLAWAYNKQGRIDESIEYYYKTQRLQPTHVPAYNNLAEILFRQGKIDQSIKVYRKGLLFVPNSSILHCNLGILLDRQGNRAEAVKELNTALQIDPNSPKIRKVLEAVLKRGN
ncbi:MAG: tetratricopeptide repeat protein [Planctomycetes bacterium]|nr:tetratricopeptide repeat protein [Planctomycetota bacterium]MBL7145951.1 tetratricopeptide repeat protein [Phycisphaerae bacterium]